MVSMIYTCNDSLRHGQTWLQRATRYLWPNISVNKIFLQLVIYKP